MSDIEFEQALRTQINRFSMENGSDTPDFILAHYLYLCLFAFEEACNERQEWYEEPQKETDAALGRALREAIPTFTEDMIPGLVGLFEVFRDRDISFGNAIALIGQGQKWEWLREKWPGVPDIALALMSRATGVVSCPDEEYEQNEVRSVICDLLRVTTWEQALARLRGEKETVT